MKHIRPDGSFCLKFIRQALAAVLNYLCMSYDEIEGEQAWHLLICMSTRNIPC